MKTILCGLFFAASLSTVCAQEDTTQVLQEVTVNGSRVTNKIDGLQIIPTQEQLKTSPTGYSLLAKLALPLINVNETLREIGVADNSGAVEMRINGVTATRDDLVSLDMAAVTSIDYIDNPGLRYGEDIAIVINFNIKRAVKGYTLGFDGMNALTRWSGDNMVFGTMNKGKSEWGMTYDFSYYDVRDCKLTENATYLLNDGTRYAISRQTEAARSRLFGNAIGLKYSLADSTNYVFQASVDLDFNHSPGNFEERRIIDGTTDYLSRIASKDRNFSPSIDLYYFHQLNEKQSLTANLVATHIQSQGWNFSNEGASYAYDIAGRMYAAIGEAIYEHKLKPFTLSAGINGSLRYTRNEYSGDAKAVNRIRSSRSKLFGQINGKWGKFSYLAGISLNYQYSEQGTHQYDHWTARPKLTLSYSLGGGWRVKYSVETSQYTSQVAMTSDAILRMNSMEWKVGNPDLRPYRRTEQSCYVTLDKPRFSNYLNISTRNNSHCNMEKVIRTDDDRFLNTQTNQKACNMLYATNYVRYDIIPQKVTAYGTAGIFRFFNRGDDYKHLHTSYMLTAGLYAFLGQWTLMANYNNGWEWMEGERLNKQGKTVSLSASYQWKDITLSLICRQPFDRCPTTNRAELMNQYIHKQTWITDKSQGNVLSLSLSWKINKGRQYQDIQRTMKNQDTDTGILKK